MERPSLMMHGVLGLPPGFRFHPTDEELVVQYLRRKVFSLPLPASIIPEIDLCRYNPWDLPSGTSEERYFFNLREAKYPNGKRSNRATGSGYWKATGKDKPVTGRGNQVVGMKKVLVFYRGKPPNGSRTDWIMHEYRLAGGSEAGACIFPQRTGSNTKVPTKDWVLSRIFMKKRATRMDVEDAEHGGIRFIDFMRQRDGDLHPTLSSPSRSESSCVTELSDGSSSGEETSSNSMSSSP